MAGKGNGGAGGDGGSILWSIIWFVILIFVGFWLGGFCAGFHILFQPFSVCIEGCSVIKIIKKIPFKSHHHRFLFSSPGYSRDPAQGIPFPENLRREHDGREIRILKNKTTFFGGEFYIINVFQPFFKRRKYFRI